MAGQELAQKLGAALLALVPMAIAQMRELSFLRHAERLGEQLVCRRFQAEKRLTVDGIVGQRTWAATWTAPVT